MDADVLRPRKRLGRMRRGKKLGIIIPVGSERRAREGQGEAGEPEERQESDDPGTA